MSVIVEARENHQAYNLILVPELFCNIIFKEVGRPFFDRTLAAFMGLKHMQRTNKQSKLSESWPSG